MVKIILMTNKEYFRPNYEPIITVCTTGRLLVFLVILISMFSCEKSIVIEGNIISSKSGKPINHALIKFVDRDVYTYSDQDGNFTLEDFGGYSLSDEFIITHKRYKPFRMKQHSSGNFQSYSVWSNSEFYYFEQPFYFNSEDTSSFIVGTWVDDHSSTFEAGRRSFTFKLDTFDLQSEIQQAYLELQNQ